MEVHSAGPTRHIGVKDDDDDDDELTFVPNPRLGHARVQHGTETGQAGHARF